MNAVESQLVHLDNAWNHDWESLLAVLAGVGEEEANWQAPSYADVDPVDGWPAPGSIRWHVAHVAHCKREYTGRLNGDREKRTPDLPHAPTGSFAEDLAELHAAHDAERATVAALTADELTPVVVDFLANITRHDIWHAGAIAVVRRMWRRTID
ncbi:MAG: DinB family protein [Planctomycetota bacterium]|jgi:hypothetical protein